MTAPVWIRGILSDEYGVPVDGVDVRDRRRGGAGPRREAASSTCRRDPRRAHRPDADAVARCSPTARSTRCTRRARRRRSHAAGRRASGCSPDFVEVETRVLPPHADLPDHARRSRSAARSTSANRWIAQSLYKAFVAAQRHDLPRPRRDRGAEGDAAVAHRARRGGARADGRRLVVVRPRAATATCWTRSCAITTSRACRSAALARGAVRAGDAGVLPDLKGRP